MFYHWSNRFALRDHAGRYYKHFDRSFIRKNYFSQLRFTWSQAQGKGVYKTCSVWLALYVLYGYFFHMYAMYDIFISIHVWSLKNWTYGMYDIHIFAIHVWIIDIYFLVCLTAPFLWILLIMFKIKIYFFLKFTVFTMIKFL